MELTTTIIRTDTDGTPIECEATISFTAEMTSPGYRATQMHPGDGPEYRCTFESAELEIRFCPVPGKLSDAEMQVLRAWFKANHDKAVEAADGCFEREPANDNGWRGLEA